MSGEALQLLLRKTSARTSKAARVVRPVEPIRRAELIERRGVCMAEIARWRSGTDVSESLSAKAQQLLTRQWSTSCWRARADIVRTAEWLVGISKGAAGASPASSPDRGAGSRAHKRDAARR
jgi:hypothetical protein